MKTIPNIFCFLMTIAFEAVQAGNPYTTLMPINEPITLNLTPSVTSSCKKFGGIDENSLAEQGSKMMDVSIDKAGKKFFTLYEKDNQGFMFEVTPNGGELQPKVFVKSGEVSQELTADILNSQPPLRRIVEAMKSVVNGRLGKSIRQGDKYPVPDACAMLGGKASASSEAPYLTWSGTATINGRDVLVAVGDIKISCEIENKKINLRVKSWYSYDIFSALDAGDYEEVDVEINSANKLRLISKTTCEVRTNGQ